MNDHIWYVYQQGQQLGPFATPQLEQMIKSQMVATDAYIFKIGWKDWRPLEDVYEELGLPHQPPRNAKNIHERRAAAPRATISGRVIVHNNGQLVIGKGVNISFSGIFVETNDSVLFKVGEKLKLSVRVDGLKKAFNTMAIVMRYNSDPRHPVGFGLQFEQLEQKIQGEIQDLINKTQGGSANKGTTGMKPR